MLKGNSKWELKQTLILLRRKLKKLVIELKSSIQLVMILNRLRKRDQPEVLADIQGTDHGEEAEVGEGHQDIVEVLLAR